MTVRCPVPTFVKRESKCENADQFTGPVAEQPANIDFSMPWSFADMPVGAIEQWFDSI